jgi:hypothetical protein
MIRLLLISVLVVSTISIPIAVFHGVGDLCLNPGMKKFTQELGEGATSYSKCIEIGNGSATSWLMDFKE